MSDSKPIPSSGFNLSSINGVLNIILSAFSIPQIPVEPLPPPLIMIGAKLRPGISAQSIAAEIISKQSNSGRVVGDVFADGPNSEEAMEVIRIQGIIDAILNEAKVDVVIQPGIAVYTVGASPLGPVVSQGYTTAMGIGDGIIR
jgi:hypothetical protein